MRRRWMSCALGVEAGVECDCLSVVLCARYADLVYTRCSMCLFLDRLASTSVCEQRSVGNVVVW